MTESKPHISIIAGPNGSGKSTCGPAILQNIFQISEFVNADTIATGLSAFQPGDVAIEASRIMLNRLKELASRKENFAFETPYQVVLSPHGLPKLKKMAINFLWSTFGYTMPILLLKEWRQGFVLVGTIYRNKQ